MAAVERWRADDTLARRRVLRLGRAARDGWRRAPRWSRLAAGLAAAGVIAAVAGFALWTGTTAARLDLDAVQQTPLVFAAGRPLRPGVAIQGVGESLDRLRYREVSNAPANPGEFRRTPGRWEIHLRAREDASRPAMRVRLDVRGVRIVEVADLSGDADLPGAELEPELLTGVGETGLERRRPLALADMSRFIPAAVLAAEDHRFFDHGGIDLLAVGRALVVNASRGEIAQGASTLTQQLVKNLALGPERTWGRKVREGGLALALERRYPKEKILEAYLNTVYLGQHGRAAVLGVGAAAQSYWRKDARRLSLAESALLAGMIRAPNRYSPVDHPERAQGRRDAVLRRMHELGSIDGPALEAALAERTGVRAGAGLPSQAPYFLDYVRAATPARRGAESPRIYTTLDPGLQRAAETAVARGLDRLESAHRNLRRSPSGERIQAALVALDPATGEVRALVGGRDYEASAFNRATHARRQPGSAFKPFVFLAALRRGAAGQAPAVTPASLVEDLPIEVETLQEAWAPRNFEDRFDGLITVRQALERSSNAAAVRLAQAAGLDRVVRTARDVGFKSRMTPVPALALGSFEVTPLELAAAYAALANGGRPVTPLGVRAVGGRGDALATRGGGEVTGGVSSVSPEEAYLLTYLLSGVIDRGTGAAARALGLGGAAAGKTGTTNDTRDAWFAGYSPRLVAVVWIGFDDGTPLGLSGARAALPIWADFMRAAAALEDPGEFAVPPTVVFRQACGSPFPEAFLPLTEPDEPCGPVALAGAPGQLSLGDAGRRVTDDGRAGPLPMTLDDLFLRAQAVIDRIIRRLRLGPPPVAGRRRLLIVQIDGLSRVVLEQALARGHMPVLRRLVGRDGHRLSPMTVGIPTSTPAFQMAAMYGVQPDIPGFHYHDKRRRTDIHFPRAGHAAFVEASQAANRAGILQGGSVYGCAFTGGAEHDFFSFARLTRPRMPGLLRVLSAFVLVGWVAAKCAALTATELVRTLGRIARRPRERAVGMAMVQEEDRRVGVDPPVVHVRGRPRRVRRRAGDLRQLPRSRRGGPRVRAPEPPGLRGASRGRPIAPTDPPRAPPSARAPLRPLRSLGSRPGVLHALFRDGRRPAVRARVA